MALEADGQQVALEKEWSPPLGKRWTAQDGQAMAEALKKSRETPIAFAVRYGIAADRVNWWLRRLGRTPTGKARPGGQVVFAPVKLLAGKALKPIAPAERCRLEVVLRGGRAVRVGADFDAVHLRRLIAALEGQAQC